MIFSISRRALAHLVGFAVVLSILLSVFARDAAADAGDPPEVEARRLVHVLGYVAADYGGAVASGVVKNESEYEEQRSLLGDAAKIAARLPTPEAAKGSEPVDLPKLVAKVSGLVDAKGSEADVAAAAGSARAAIIAAFKLAEAPSSAPNAARGKALYNEHCATCHGQDGHADTQRAATLSPRPANFHDPNIGDQLTPFRAASTVRFGVSGTAMVPFTFLSDAEQWDLAFYVVGLRRAASSQGGSSSSPTYALAELAARSDKQLREELRAAGVAEASLEAILTDLRTRAPYEDRAGRTPLAIARAKLDRARVAITRGETDAARGPIIDAYLEGIEPVEPSIRAADPALASAIEGRFRELRAKLEGHAPAAELGAAIGDILRELTRAEALLAAGSAPKSFLSTALSSAGILLREGVEAALLIAALLGIAAQAGLADRKRYVHFGWATALVLGLITWIVSSKIIAISGARRELIEGVTAVLATLVLFYVSYSLLAKKEVARWMRFLRGRVSGRNAALSLFSVSLLAAYREVFETVLFYQALLASNADVVAAIAGAFAGAIALTVLVVVYTRAGRFAPPQVFFKVSSFLLYALAVIFAGQGVASLQLSGIAPLHPLRGPTIPALGLYPTIETLGAQLLLIALAVVALVVNRSAPSAASAKDPPLARSGPDDARRAEVEPAPRSPAA